MNKPIRRPFRALTRGGLLLVAALVIPSCSSGGGGGLGPTDLFVDDFDAGLGSWTIVSPSVTIDAAGIGRGPAMKVVAQAGVPAEAQTTATYSTAGGLSISVDVEPGASVSELQIVDSANPAIQDTYILISDNSVHCSIQGQTQKVDFPPDIYPHKFLFFISRGNAQWQRDGKVEAQFSYGAPNTVFLTCRDLDSGSLFDLVHISSP